jgi:hypothetical protein
MPFVVPETQGEVGFVVSFSKKAGLEEIVGKNAGLGKAITALANFEVNPNVTLTTFKFVFLNEFCLNVCDFYADIFRVRHWGIEVEVFEVNGAEACAWAREHTVEKQLDKFKGCRVGSNVTQEADAIAANGDAGAIRIIFIRLHFTYHHGVANFFLFMGWDVMILYKKEGVSARDPLGIGGNTRTNVLAQPSKFIGVRGVPDGFVAGVTMELAMLKKFASGGVKHQKSL